MTDQTPDAAREARKDVLFTMLNGYGPDSEASAEQYAKSLARCEAENARDLDTYAAAVSRARDAAWRSAVEEQAALWLYHRDTDDHFGISWDRKREEYKGKVAGLMAMLLARMDTATIKQEPTDV